MTIGRIILVIWVLLIYLFIFSSLDLNPYLNLNEELMGFYLPSLDSLTLSVLESWCFQQVSCETSKSRMCLEIENEILLEDSREMLNKRRP